MPAIAKRPSLRKVPTLTLKSSDESSSSGSLRKLSSKPSLRTKSSVTSLKKKASLVSEGSGIYSSLEKLASGSSVGKTGSFNAASDGKICDVLPVPPSLLSKRRSSLAVSPAIATLRKSVSEVESLIKSASEAKTTLLERKSSLAKKSSLSKKPSLSKRKSSARPSSDIGDEDESSNVSPPLPPGGLLEIAISFDTTGSMYGYLEEVRGRIKDMVQRLQADIPGIRIALIAHGDYCDSANYIVKWIDFGASVPELCDFAGTVDRTSGGDGDECYELVLRRTREVLSWTPGSQRSLVMIGDASPHEPGYRYGDFVNDINWRVEAEELRKMGVKIYSVCPSSGIFFPQFYKVISQTTGGTVLQLNNFNVIFDILMSICYKEGGSDLLHAYEAEVRDRNKSGPLDTSLGGLFTTLKGGPDIPTDPVVYPWLPIGGGLTTKTIIAKPKTAGAAKSKPKPKAYEAEVRDRNKSGSLDTSLGGLFTTLKGGPGIPTDPVVYPWLPTGGGLMTKTIIAKPKTAGAAKSKPKQKKAKRKSKAKDISGRVPRESLTDSKYSKGPLKRLTWTKWQFAVSKAQILTLSEEVGPSINWKYQNWCDAYCNRAICGKDEVTGVPAVYEFAIRLSGKKKVYPVFYKVTTGVPRGGTWYSYLLSQKRVREAVKDVVSKNATVMVRRGAFKRNNTKFFQKVSQLLWKKYDYAWTARRDRMSKFRNLKRCGCHISRASY